MNKGFEVIEAHHLFGVPYERIDVVVHPQSLVHSLIQLIDGSTLAHLGYPDMRVPISYALNFPERAPVDVPRLDLAAVGALTFEEPDPDTFACLRLALEAGEAGGTAPTVLNAADEVAVAAFLDGRIPFTGIAAVIERMLEEMPARPVTHFDDLFATDAEARERAAAAGPGADPRMSWVYVFLGFCAADPPARGRPLRRRQGDRDAGRELLPLLRADPLVVQARRDRVRDQIDPARRLREDQRDEPGGRDASGGRAPRLLPAEGLEADRRRRGGPGGQHRRSPS